MRHAGPILLAFVVSTSACGGGDMNESIEKMNEGIELYGAGRVAEAEKHFEEAAALAEDNHRAWYNLGQARDKLKKYEESAQAYEQAVKAKPDDAMYHYRLGKAMLEVEQAAPAETHLQKSVDLNGRLYKAHYYLGKVRASLDKPAEAASSWTTSAKLAPFFGKPFNELGKLYIKWDMLPEAVSVLDQGSMHVKDGDELTDIYYHLGLAYEKQGNWDKAVEAYSGAIETRSGNLDALRQRGFAYAEAGDAAKAREDLEAFIDQGGGGNAFHLQAANERLFRLTGD